MAGWQLPEGMSGDHGLVRVRPADAKGDERRCPQRLAMKVRPGVSRTDRAVKSDRGMEKSSVGPLNEVLDLIEFDLLSVEDALERWRERLVKPCHPALAQWTAHAVRSYLAAAAEIAADSGLVEEMGLEPVSRQWARQRRSAEGGASSVYEETVTGRRYARRSVRELRLLRTRSVEDRQEDKAEIAVAAGVLAGASPVLSARWERKKLALGTSDSVSQVRVVEVGLADGSHRVLFDGTVDEAHHRYAREAKERLSAVTAGGGYRPGEDCAECPLVDACPAVPSRPGFLGVGDSTKPRRSWSATTWRTYRKCPAQAHLQDLFLPRDSSAEDSEATRRGQAVHKWIEDQHSRVPARGCGPAEVPGPPEKWKAGRWVVEGSQARLGVQMVGDHALTCPLRGLPEDAEVYPERPVVVYDPDADVVVIAKTDLLYRSADRWVLRETKTCRVLDEGDLLVQYPQLALAVLLSAEGVLPGGEERCRVELERLTGTGPVVSELDVDDPDLVDRARRIVSEHAAGWHADTRFKARPSKECVRCPFTRWCPEAVVVGER